MKPKRLSTSPGQRLRRLPRARSRTLRDSGFHPAATAIHRAYDRVAEGLETHQGPPRWVVESVRDDFVMPVTRRDLARVLNDVPTVYTRGLKAVFLLGGSRKQEKVFFSSLYCYGTYWNECIFLHPYPKRQMQMYFRRRPKPSLLHEYQRVGAVVKRDDQAGVWVRFRPHSLKRFYLQDVFLHEVGHHADRFHEKPEHRSEGYADWFAGEYGFRRRK